MTGRGGRLLLSTGEAASTLGVRPATIRDWHRRGIVTPAGRNRWDLADLVRARAAPRPRRVSEGRD